MNAATLLMTTAVIGTGMLGSAIARLVASGGETVRLSSADEESVRRLAIEIGRAAVVAGGGAAGDPLLRDRR